ncbi:MAG TPA: OsmC family protein [Anaerolineae bacterium]|nr:OsmC family protein [Anaerolineae bacterium]
MTEELNLEGLKIDQVFDGGDLDCGSGLVLLIREQMLRVPVGGVLEMRSREPTVEDDLPPWCRMAGHAYLGRLQAAKYTRYFMRRGEGAQAEAQALAADKARAKSYEWRLRTRATGHLKSTVYCRNFSFDVGQAASFEEKDAFPSAVEYLLGALAASLASGLATEAARDGLELDDVELTTRGTLDNVLAILGLEEGDPSVSTIEVKCFASTLDDEAKVRAAWERAVQRSPLVATLRKAVELKLKLAIT